MSRCRLDRLWIRSRLAACFGAVLATSACGPKARPDPVGSMRRLASGYRAACAAVVSCLPAGRMPVEECASRRSRRRWQNHATLVYWNDDLSPAELRCVLRVAPDCGQVAACLGADRELGPCEVNDEYPQQGSCRPGFRVTASMPSSPSLAERCALHGLRARSYPGSRAVPKCEGSGARCSPNDSARCEAGELVGCYQGQEWRFPCAVAGRVCRDLPLSGSRPQATCASVPRCAAGEERCEGSILRFCDDGLPVMVDCAALGFTRCVQQSGRAVCE